MDYRYFYILWSLLFFLLWGCFFWWRPDLRHSVLRISLLFGFGGVISQLLYLSDWWQPLTITHTSIGPEDFLIGFSIAGVAAVVYKTLRRRILERRETILMRPYTRMFLLGFAAVFVGTFLLTRSSFWASLVPYVFSIAGIWYLRRDLIAESIMSGLLLLIIGISIYALLFIPYPDFIHRFWYLPHVWFAQLFFGIPIAEYIWFFMTGAFVGPLYPFLRDYRSVPVRFE